MKNQMSPELRFLRKNHSLPISRQAYTKIYQKAVEVLSQLAAFDLPGLGTVDSLFRMLADSYADAPHPDPAGSPLLYGIYCCLRADVEAARLRSVAARERAAKRATAKASETSQVSEISENSENSEKSQPKVSEKPKRQPEPQPVKYRYGIPVKPPTSISSQNWGNSF